MELFWGFIKIDNEFLASHPNFTVVLLIIIVIFLVILTLGKYISRLVSTTRDAYLTARRIKKIEDWVADCRERRGWTQKGDANALELEGKYLQELTFIVEPVGNPNNWRGGFILGNPSFSPTSIVDSQNAITCHVGSPPVHDDNSPVWIYDTENNRNSPHSTLVRTNRKRALRFLVTVNENNFLTIEVEEQVVYAKRIDPSFRKKVYLLAWGDDTDCRVKFSGITYYIQNH